MVCPVYHSLCDGDTVESWGIFLNNAAETFTILSCSVRDNLRQINGGFSNFKAHGCRYSLDVYRGYNITVIGGDDWVKFIANLNLGGGELVVFNASRRMVKAYVCYVNLSVSPEVIVIDEDQGGEGDVPEEEVLNDEHTWKQVVQILFTTGMVC